MSKWNVLGAIGTGLRQFSGIFSVVDISGNNQLTSSSNTLSVGSTIANQTSNIYGSGPFNILGGTLNASGRVFGGSGLIEMTPSTGTFNATFSGPFSSPQTVPFNWVKQGKEVTLHIPRIGGPPPAVATNLATAPAGSIPALLVPVNAGAPADPTTFVWTSVTQFTANSLQPSSCYFGIGADGSVMVLAVVNWLTTGTGNSGGWCATSMRYQTAT